MCGNGGENGARAIGRARARGRGVGNCFGNVKLNNTENDNVIWLRRRTFQMQTECDIYTQLRRLGSVQPGNRFVSFVCTRGLVALWSCISNSVGRPSPFSLLVPGSFPFSLLGPETFLAPFPHPANLLSNFSWAHR